METVHIALTPGQLEAFAVIGSLFSFVIGWSIFGWSR